MNKELAIKLSLLPIIKEINDINNLIAKGTIPKEISNKIFQKLKLDWNYNSNAIEGNQLNYGETVAFLMHGMTAKGKTLKDHLDIKGHNEAINYLLNIIKEERNFTEVDIRSLHKIILVEEYETDAITSDGIPTKKRIKLGSYKTTPNSVKTRTGEMHYYATPEETPALMNDLMQWHNNCINDENIHPIVLASLFHYHFVAIHPFDDGNGRLARILMNLILMRRNYFPVVVKNEDKSNYYGVLAQADQQQYIPLIEYMGKLLTHSLNIKWRAINGESIEEESDIDKEIALLKKGLDKTISEREKRNNTIVALRAEDSFSKLFYKIKIKITEFDGLFFDIKQKIRTDNTENVWSLSNFLKAHYTEVIFYNISLERYKADEKLSISKEIKIFLNDYKYHVYFNSKSIAKYYNEPLSKKEIDDFVNAIMKDILAEIKQHTST